MNMLHSVQSIFSKRAVAIAALFASLTLTAGNCCYSEESRHCIVFENSSDGSIFSVDATFVHQGNEVTVQFPLFNFETIGSGGTLTSINKLPHKYRPTSDQTFICSNNDAYLQAFSIEGPYPTPLNTFELVVGQSGELTLSYYGDPIEAGGHTFNSQTVGYPVSRSGFDPKTIIFTHAFTQQLLDYNFIPYPGSDFALTVSVELQGRLVTLAIPSIEFYISSETSPLNQAPFPLILGGYVGTMSDFLPKHLRPEQIQTIYEPVSGLNFSLDTYGLLTISSPSDITAVIPTGSYITAPVSITYYLPLSKDAKIDNFIIQEGFTTFTGFTDVGIPISPLNAGIRDQQVNDLYKGIAAFAWSGNVDQPDKDNNAMDTYVAIGRTRHGKLEVEAPIKVTDNPANVLASEAAIAINRINPENLVVSYRPLYFEGDPLNLVAGPLFVSVSQDYGLTWSGPINVDPTDNQGYDCRGVIADKYGNFWFNANAFPSSGPFNLVFYVSSDGGYTWTRVFETTDATSDTGSYDYPQIAVGNDGQGNYGLWFAASFFNADDNIIPRLGFIPTTGLGLIGTGTYIDLPSRINQIADEIICVNKEGELFLNSTVGSYAFDYNFYADTLAIKFPGPLVPELVSEPKTILNTYQNILPANSYPVYFRAYYPNTVNNSFYDEENGALVMVYSERPDVFSQDYYLYLTASFDKGTTWSRKIQISDSHKNNRGFSSIAYDPRDGIAIGWYDSRNSPKSTGEQYFGAYVSRAELNCMLRDLKRNG